MTNTTGLTKQQVIQWLIDNGHEVDELGRYIDKFGWKYRLFEKDIYSYKLENGKYTIHSHADYKDLFIDDTNGFLCGWKEYK